MLFRRGGDGYSSRTASAVESVRRRIRPPEGDLARFQTGAGNLSLDAAGSGKNSPSFFANQGRLSISSPSCGIASQRRSGAARSSGVARSEVRKVRRNTIGAEYETGTRARSLRIGSSCVTYHSTLSSMRSALRLEECKQSAIIHDRNPVLFKKFFRRRSVKVRVAR